MLSLNRWIAAVRPRTLSLSVVPVAVGGAMAWADFHRLDAGILGAAVVAAMLIQIGTNLHNDAADFERGADDPSSRLGPPRATAQGWLTPAQVRRGALLSFSGAGLAGVYLVSAGGWPILLIGLLSIAAGFAYTGGPRPIAYTALGELFVWFFFGLVALGGSYFLQTGQIAEEAVLLGAGIGAFAAAVLAVNNYRDLENDRQVGKITLAVRLGRRASRIEYAVLMLSPFALLVLLALSRGWLWMPWLLLPWALVLVRRFVREPPGRSFNRLLGATAQLQLVFGCLICVEVVARHGFGQPF